MKFNLHYGCHGSSESASFGTIVRRDSAQLWLLKYEPTENGDFPSLQESRLIKRSELRISRAYLPKGTRLGSYSKSISPSR